MDSPELLKKKTSGSQSDSAKSAARTEHVDRATSGLSRIDGRLSDSVYGENRRGEALGYITQRQGTGRDTAASQADVVQREPERGPLDRTIASLAVKKLETLSMVKFGERGVDASISDGKVGSLYFENGRFRLIHPHGPEISVKKRIRRFAVPDVKEGKLRGELREKHTMKVNEKWINDIKREYEMTELTPEVMEGNILKGQLVELFFDGDILTGHHFSRGSLQKYVIPLETGAKSVEEPEESVEKPEESVEKPEESVEKPAESAKTQISDQWIRARKIGFVAAASQLFGEEVISKIKDLLKNEESDVDINEDDVSKISNKVRECINEICGKDNPEIACLESIADKSNISKALDIAKAVANKKKDEALIRIGELANDKYYKDKVSIRINELWTGEYRKRLQGYFANQFFRASGIVEEMGLQVENIDEV